MFDKLLAGLVEEEGGEQRSQFLLQLTGQSIKRVFQCGIIFQWLKKRY